MNDHTETPTAEQVLAKMTADMGKTPEVMALLAEIKPAMVVEQARSMHFAKIKEGEAMAEISNEWQLEEMREAAENGTLK
jgi:hypothetical protein